MVVGVRADAVFTRSQPRPLFSGWHGFSGPVRSYDISPDGQRFAMRLPEVNRPEPLRLTSIHVILNWFEELRRLAPVD